MRKFNTFMTITEIDMEKNEPIYECIQIFTQDGKDYVTLKDFSKVVVLNAHLALESHEEALKKYAEGKAVEFAKKNLELNGLIGEYNAFIYEQKKNIRKRGKLIARLQKKLHKCYKTIDQLAKLCAILLKDNDNLNLCMVKAEIPTEILLKIRSYGRGE